MTLSLLLYFYWKQPEGGPSKDSLKTPEWLLEDLSQFITEVKLEGEPLEIVDEVKVLGVVIDKDLKWDSNTSYLVNKHCEVLVSCSGQKIQKDLNLNLPWTFRNLQ